MTRVTLLGTSSRAVPAIWTGAVLKNALSGGDVTTASGLELSKVNVLVEVADVLPARAFVNANRLLLIDEPSKGLAPIIVEHLVEALRTMKEHATVLLVEQNFAMARALGDWFYLIDDGRTVHSGPMEALVDDAALKKRYLGI